MEQLESQPLGSPEYGAGHLSPDGEWIFFERGVELWKLSITDGREQPVTTGFGITSLIEISSDETVYFTDTDGGLSRVPATGGERESLNIPIEGDMRAQRAPHLLPGEQTLLYSLGNEGGQIRIDLFDLETRESRTLLEDAYLPFYSSTGHLVFMREAALWAVPFDLDNLAIAGPEVLLIEGIENLFRTGHASYSLSRNGKLIYVPLTELELEGGTFPLSVLAAVDRSGNETVFGIEPGFYYFPALSPDGTRVALTVSQNQAFGSKSLWTYDLERGIFSQIVPPEEEVMSSVWTADSERLIYGTPQGIHSINANGLGEIEAFASITSATNLVPMPNSLSADGQQLIYTYYIPRQARHEHIHSLSMAPEHISTPLINTESAELDGFVSPDGRWLTYLSNESGRVELYVRPYPDVDSDKWQISTEGAWGPQWAPSGDEIFYRRFISREDGWGMYVVEIDSDPEFRAGVPQLLFTSDHLSNWGGFTVSADGQQFYMLKPVEREQQEPVPTPANVVLVNNFDEELRRLVPPFEN